MDWLNNNAPGIHALSSLATLAVTVLLACLTGWYVYLTKTLSDTAREQIRHQKDLTSRARTQSSTAVTTLAERLRVILEQLPPPPPRHSMLVQFVRISHEDVRALEALAMHVNPTAVVAASEAAALLRNFLAIVADAQSRTLEEGWQPSKPQQLEWEHILSQAPLALRAFIQACTAVPEQ